MVCACSHIGESRCVRGWFQSQLSAPSTVSTEQRKSRGGEVAQLTNTELLKAQTRLQRTRVRGCRQAQLVPKLRPEKKAGGRKECHTAPEVQHCTMVPLSTRSCLKLNKLRPILNGQFYHAIFKSIGLNLFGSKQPREILVFVILKL